MSRSRDELITLINQQIEWLEDNIHSYDILSVGKVLDKLSILAESFGEEVSEVYALANTLEDDYKISVAQYMKDNEGSAAKLEREAEVEFADKKRDWTTAKNGFKKLNTKLDRIDKILESHRQSISVLVKTSVKNMTGI
jgi:cell division protein FtsX